MNLLNISGQSGLVSMGLTFYGSRFYSTFGGVCPFNAVEYIFREVSFDTYPAKSTF